jgi:hypothetical protein
MSRIYDVRVYKTYIYRGARGVTYHVRWSVEGKLWKKTFKVKAQADSFRSELLTAARKGEPFRLESGLPLSMEQAARSMSWYEFACKFADMQWPRVAATTRRTHAEALTTVSAALLTADRGVPDGRLLRSALCRWAFNTPKREAPERPAEIRDALAWVERHTRPISDPNPRVVA